MIETRRLLLEPLSIEHAERMFTGLADPEIYAYLPENAPPSLPALQEHYRMLIAGAGPDSGEKWLNWIIVCRDSRQAIGYTQVTVRREQPALIAYMIFKSQWRLGYASEALTATIEHVFDIHDISSIEAFVDTRNIASQNLVLNQGFRFMEKIEQADFFKGQPSDEYRYRLMRDS